MSNDVVNFEKWFDDWWESFTAAGYSLSIKGWARAGALAMLAHLAQEIKILEKNDTDTP